jgi:hypothetical protein
VKRQSGRAGVWSRVYRAKNIDETTVYQPWKALAVLLPSQLNIRSEHGAPTALLLLRNRASCTGFP